jgi:hypothetical protein
VLSLHTAALPLRQVEHSELERAQERVGRSLLVGARVGDDQVFVDQAGGRADGLRLRAAKPMVP